jgi:hypothetical protein
MVWVLAQAMENPLGEGFLEEGLPFSFFKEREILAVTVLQLLKLRTKVTLPAVIAVKSD